MAAAFVVAPAARFCAAAAAAPGAGACAAAAAIAAPSPVPPPPLRRRAALPARPRTGTVAAAAKARYQPPPPPSSSNQQRQRAHVALSEVYGLLGLPLGAPYQEVRAAYRRTAARTHPDVDPSPAAASRFKAVALAHELLGDDALRRLCGSQGLNALGAKFSFLRDYLVGHGGGSSTGSSSGSGGGGASSSGGSDYASTYAGGRARSASGGSGNYGGYAPGTPEAGLYGARARAAASACRVLPKSW